MRPWANCVCSQPHLGHCFTSLPKGCLMTSGTASPLEATKTPPYEAAYYLVDLVQRKCKVSCDSMIEQITPKTTSFLMLQFCFTF